MSKEKEQQALTNDNGSISERVRQRIGTRPSGLSYSPKVTSRDNLQAWSSSYSQDAGTPSAPKPATAGTIPHVPVVQQKRDHTVDLEPVLGPSRFDGKNLALIKNY